MTVSLKHKFTSAKSDGGDSTLVKPSNWNDEHDLTLAADRVLGRATAGAGAVEEIVCTAAGRALIDDADATAQLATLGATLASTTEVLTGTATNRTVTPDALAALWEDGGSVASAGTISLGEGGYFNITGTTTITDIDFATDKAGRKAHLKFAGALTLTHNATTLILPGGANITTAAGDVAEFVSEGSDVVRCVAYTKANGQGISGGGGLVYIGAGTGVDSTGISFTSISSYSALFVQVFLQSDSGSTPNLAVAVSSNNGSSYGADRQISTGAAYATGSGYVHISSTNVTGNKTITPSTVVDNLIYTTPSTETVVTGTINALKVVASGSSVDYTVSLFGIP
jgi:hypothetical protein